VENSPEYCFRVSWSMGTYAKGKTGHRVVAPLGDALVAYEFECGFFAYCRTTARD